MAPRGIIRQMTVTGVRAHRFLVPPLISILLLSSGCNPFPELMTTRSTRLIANGPDVERLLSTQRAQDVEVDRVWKATHKKARSRLIEQMKRDPESVYPGRKDFLLAMAKQTGELVPAETHLRLLGNSHVKCRDPLSMAKFVKVRVTSGSLDGRVGWVCEEDVYRTVVLP